MKKSIRIGKLEISAKSLPLIIAECCDNHFGKIENAIKMVDLSKKAGVDIVKFQHHLPDEEMLKSVPKSSNFSIPLYDFLKKYALSLEQHCQIQSYCKKKNIQYLCTPFSLKAALELNQIGVRAFKIGSGEMTDIPSLKEIAKLNLPMIISTGMSTIEEINETYLNVLKINKKLILMNCTSEYPPLYNDINLNFIPKMIDKFSKAWIGHSDHTSGLITSFGAISLGAKIIEKHVTLDKKHNGPDKDVSIDFNQLEQLVKDSKLLFQSLGDKKQVHKKEVQIRRWAFRSIVSICEIKKDQVITKKMIWSKRPGTGIPAKKMSQVLGKKVKRNISVNQLIKWSDLY